MPDPICFAARHDPCDAAPDDALRPLAVELATRLVLGLTDPEFVTSARCGSRRNLTAP